MDPGSCTQLLERAGCGSEPGDSSGVKQRGLPRCELQEQVEFHEQKREEKHTLISGIPNDITAEHILTKVPWKSLYVLSSLNKAWREEITSQRVFETRNRTNTSETLVAVIHDHPGVSLACALRSAVSVYSSRGNEWLLLPLIPGVLRGVPNGCGLVCLNGRLYILGGGDYGEDKRILNPRREVYYLDLGAAQGEWKQCANMSRERQDFAYAVHDGRIFVAGGVSTSELSPCPLFHAEMFDPELNCWRLIAPLLRLRTSSSATTVGEKIFVHGGLDRSHILTNAGFAELYDPSEDAWQYLDRFAPHGTKKEMSSAMAAVEGKLYNVDGNGVLIYDFATNSWEYLQPMSWQMTKRSGACSIEASAAVALDGELWVVLSWLDWMRADRNWGLVKSKGLRSENCGGLTWEKVNCLFSFNRGRPRMCVLNC